MLDIGRWTFPALNDAPRGGLSVPERVDVYDGRGWATLVKNASSQEHRAYLVHTYQLALLKECIGFRRYSGDMRLKRLDEERCKVRDAHPLAHLMLSDIWRSIVAAIMPEYTEDEEVIFDDPHRCAACSF